ncbi:alpha-amlyase [Verrucomicrobia bacterium LW23]|nr:alpha-amlyase [Verrucomicrobia bacterium LW23]
MNVLILWHMHQPYYVNPLTKTALMPWVRLHAVKGYLDMIDLLLKVPEVRVNFNFTPVLVKQIEELANDEVLDLWESWSRKPAWELHVDEKIRVLENFFKVNWESCIKPYPRYWDLLNLRGFDWTEKTMPETVHLFTEQDFRDLQVWYNLAWCGFSAERRYPLIAELKKQGRDFTEQQKTALLDVHKEILRTVLGLYREAQERGQIEVTTTPFFHPIMPLVYDTDFARRCQPHSPLPMRFTAPDDVRAHLRLSQELHERVFGRKATGLWPSEGSVAPELIPLFQEAGIEYFCTDEGNLFRSLEKDPVWASRAADHLELFQGWRIRNGSAHVNAIFRERPLSDFIGFNAARNPARQSADYLLNNLDHLSGVVQKGHGAVLLALDGENAWEAFADSGEEFLTLFYKGIAERHHLRSKKLKDYFTEFPPVAECTRLHSGSWINSDFDIWIGDPEENRGWELIGQTRKFLTDTIAKGTVTTEQSEAAWWEIYAAEGSDWFWWYGPDFTTECDFLFDELFRTHLQNVYRILGYHPPANLELPICLPSEAISYSSPHRYIHPPLTGSLQTYYDWVGAGLLNILQQQTAMFQADRMGQQLLFGFNNELFYLRLDTAGVPNHIGVQFTTPYAARVDLKLQPDGKYAATLEDSPDAVKYTVIEDAKVIAERDHFLVVGIPIKALRWTMGGKVSFFVQLYEEGLQRERYPERGALEFAVPTPDFEASQWFI